MDGDVAGLGDPRREVASTEVVYEFDQVTSAAARHEVGHRVILRMLTSRSKENDDGRRQQCAHPQWLAQQLQTDDPDMLRSMVKTMAEALMSADADGLCGLRPVPGEALALLPARSRWGGGGAPGSPSCRSAVQR
ncbi:hypothetical protein [Spongiactinospora sp. 9N601]|uniref:hypothetical protein n=1 Tax=Spongiactinospora sp. 9N601 TaxID=3375149 RepID=UPI0037A606B8